ncbi:hypothetical protein M378DRAFT_311289 [Amanita muscaria Koide BX008]|uniref:AAA-ATPase-like domain-containing protein n=1 Tax=Amanita muscaria (strain Koide BX008) TaxID=946122 RepID=A0A0C2WPJ6_AMAMK|nr:hypothetical protein M378DRAFT_311289 [Amanita muscaria Koide BX008]
MIREFLQRPLRPESDHARAKTTSRFESTAIIDHRDLVSTHFRQYPVLYVDLKDVHGTTFEDMQTSFDAIVIRILKDLSNPIDGVLDQNFLLFCDQLYHEQGLLHPRGTVLQVISQILQRVFIMPVVVLIDEYDTPIHSAIEHNYADLASDFFATVFGSLLKNNDAVYASMMVGIWKVAKSGWLSQLNHLEIFPMHAEDDRYAKFFLFTEEEVEILCNAHERVLSIEALQPHYNGYAARCSSGFVKLYNPFSVVRALGRKKISNYWVETENIRRCRKTFGALVQGFVITLISF